MLEVTWYVSMLALEGLEVGQYRHPRVVPVGVYPLMDYPGFPAFQFDIFVQRPEIGFFVYQHLSPVQ